MPSVITVEQLAEMVCRALDIPAKDNVENLSEILRPALSKAHDEAIERQRLFPSRSPRMKPSAAAASERASHSRRRSPSRHVSENGTLRCGDLETECANVVCPECLSDNVEVREYDFGICQQTGYHDTGERFQCRTCGAAGDIADLVRTVAAGRARD